MRLIDNIDRDIRAVKQELYRLEAKLERLQEERGKVLDKYLEEV